MNGLKKFQTVVSMLKTLSADYIERLALMLSEGEFSSQNLNTLAKEERYTDGRICPHCNSKHIEQYQVVKIQESKKCGLFYNKKDGIRKITELYKHTPIYSKIQESKEKLLKRGYKVAKSL